MLQKIKLKNFQSLKDVTINLGRVTVLRGKSDVGKSAVIRGLNAFFNNSFNQEYAHNGELPFGIAIQKDNKVVFGRRTAKGVEYKFDSTVYSKTAKKIPADISNFLGIYPYAIDVDMSIFFQVQKQFDTPFLLTDSSTTVAKIIGRVSNLNIVLMAMREMYATQLETKQEVNYLYSRKKELKNSLLHFSNFETYEEMFKRAEYLEDSIEDLSNSKQKLFELIKMGENYNARVRTFKRRDTELSKFEHTLRFVSRFYDIQNIITSIYNVEEKRRVSDSTKIEALSNSVDALLAIKTKFNLLADIINSFSFLNSKKLQEESSLLILEGLDLNLFSKLREVIAQSAAFNERVRVFRELSKEVSSLEEEYSYLYNSFTEGKVICPFSKLEMQDFCKKHLAQ